MDLRINPGGVKGVLSALDIHGETVDLAFTGDCATLCIEAPSKLKKGMVVSQVKNPCKKIGSMEVHLDVKFGKVEKNNIYSICIHTIMAKIKVTNILGGNEGFSYIKKPEFVKKGNWGKIVLTPLEPMAAEAEIEGLEKLMLIDENHRIVGTGHVLNTRY